MIYLSVVCCLTLVAVVLAVPFAGGIVVVNRSCDFTAHMCTGIIHEDYKLFVNPLFMCAVESQL